MPMIVMMQIQPTMLINHRPRLKLNEPAAAWRTNGLRSL